MKKIYFFLGTTAELIKVAPVIAELKRRKIDFKVVASNQNELRFDELEFLLGKLSPDYAFKMKSFKWPKNIYVRFLFWTLKSLVNYILYFSHEFGRERKDIFFIVHGDTISALIGTFIAKIYGVKLVHIESGLRSFDFFEPFPEEICRYIISSFADVHFCPNPWSVKNLSSKQGVKVNTRANTIGETVFSTLRNSSKRKLAFDVPTKYFITILHRQEHTAFNKNEASRLLGLVVDQSRKDLECVLVLHKITEDFLRSKNLLNKLKKSPNVILVPRLPYADFIQLMKASEFIVSDGGSNQEEAYYLGKPCLILRNKTERIEGLGRNAVLAKGDEGIILSFFKNYKKYRFKHKTNFRSPSEIIVKTLLKLGSSGSGNFEILDWDSKNFGYKVAEIDSWSLNRGKLKNLLKRMSRDGVKLAYLFVKKEDRFLNKIALQNGGFLADRKVTYIRQVTNEITELKDSHIRSYIQKPLNNQLRFLSLEAGVYSRYRLDPNFVGGEFEKLYTIWIENSLSGGIARDVLVFKDRGREIGMVTLGDKKDRCNIGLIAIDPNYRGMGIGSRIMKAALFKAKKWGYKEMDVVTQYGNRGACLFYEKSGFKVESVVNVYHFWL